MTSAPTAARVRAVVLLVLVVGVVACVGLVVLQYRAQVAERAAQYERDAEVAAPAGFGADGLQVGDGDEGRLVVQTDLSCPACQELFADHGEDIARYAASGERSVVLQVVHARQGSTTNQVALEHLFAAVGAGGADPLAVYRAVSGAVRGMADDAPRAEVESAVVEALAGIDVRVTDPVGPLAPDELRWLSARTYENRQGPGSVPAVLLDGEQVEGDALPW